MDAAERFRAAERAEIEAESSLKKAQLERFKAQRAVIFSVIAEDPGVIWTATRIAETLMQRGLAFEDAHIQQFLDGGVRQTRLSRVSSGYQLIRPEILKSLTHPLRARG